MKKFIKEMTIWFSLIIFFLMIILSISIIRYDFNYGHISHSTFKKPYNWIPKFTTTPLKKLYISIFSGKEIYLPQTKIYIDDSSLKSLTSDLPYSTKKWKKAKINYSGKRNLENIQLRYRGDNPGNWLMEKKSIRIRFRNNQKFIEYWPFDLSILTSSRIAKNSGVYVSNVKPVELFINDVSNGIFLELERLDKNFLKRNNIKSANFYKGENYNTERRLGLENNLYNNSGLWTKLVYSNKIKKENKDDLLNFLRLLKESSHNIESFNKLTSYIDLDIWGRFLAYIIISQDPHHTSWHNNRVVFNAKNNQVVPVVVDPSSNLHLLNKNKIINLEDSSNDLIKLLNQSSIYLDNKYSYLNNFLTQSDLLEKEVSYLNSIESNIFGSAKRDPQKTSKNLSNKEFRSYYNKHKNNLINGNKIILKNLYLDPQGTWKKKTGKFNISVSGQIPSSNIKLFFKGNVPKWVYIDENYNGVFDDNEIKYYSKDKNFIVMNADLYANRFSIRKDKNFLYSNIETGKTKFDFITEGGFLPDEIEVENKFSKRKIVIIENQSEGSQTVNLNKVIHKS